MSESQTIKERLRQMAFLNKGVRIILVDERDVDAEEKRSDEFYFKGGVKEFVQWLNRNRVPMTDDVIYCDGKEEDVGIEIAMQYNDTYSPSIYSFCNNISTTDGGTHEEGFRMALTRVLNNYARANKFLKEHNCKEIEWINKEEFLF